MDSDYYNTQGVGNLQSNKIKTLSLISNLTFTT